ncbi:MAG: flagellar hook-associated protein FlgL, partial [Desulfonatronovibrio sp.]
MRVSQSMLFNNFVKNMNSSSYELMELNKQAFSQKKINRPSDDPIGTSRVLSYRDSISSLEQYKSNVDTAKGWLGLADETLMQANNVLIRSKEVAEQAATGTISADQREILSYEARQLMDQMINLSNARYEKKSIFGGHKVDGSAFEPAMNLSSNKDLPSDYTIEGKASGTVLVQFTSSGEVNNGSGTDIDYRYSTDGGKTWTDDSLGDNQTELNIGGLSVGLPSSGYTVEANDPDNTNDTSGTWLWVRPTARYNGDDQDENKVSVYAEDIDSGDVSVAGVFDKDVTVRIDEVSGSDITYSYSLDEGSNWNTGNTTTVDGTDDARFLVPGGRVDISGVAAGDYNENDQILIRPHRAAIDVEISANEEIQINSVGKDIFGGIYKKPG